MKKQLKYLGPGFVPGFPAKDIEVDAETAETLVAGGAYEFAPLPKKQTNASKKTTGKPEKEEVEK